MAVDEARLQQAWEAAGNSGKRPAGWYGSGGSPGNPNYGDGGGGGGSAGAIADALNSQLKVFKDRENEFAKNNPFVMDTVLKEEAAKVKERLDPYYNQVLGNYLQGQEIKKSRSLQDERNLLGQLSQTTDRYNQQQKDILRNSLDQIDQGNANNDMSGSGFNARQQGNQLADTQTGLEAYNQTAANTANQTQIQGERYRNYDVPLNESIYKNQANAERTANEYAQTYSQEQQRQNQWQYAQQQYAGDVPGSTNLNFQTDVYKLLGNPTS